MFLAVHASVGAIAGNATGNPILAFVTGFLLHFAADLIPHGDEHMYEGFKTGAKVRRALFYVAADAIATGALIAMFFIREDFFNPVNVSLGIIGGLMPDALVGIYEVAKPKGRNWFSRAFQWFHRFHMHNHHFMIKHFRKFERDIPLRYGLMIQGVTLYTLVRILM